MIQGDLVDTKEVVMDRVKTIGHVAKVFLHQEVRVEVEVVRLVVAHLILEIQDLIYPIRDRITYKIE